MTTGVGMAELKTKATDASVEKFIDTLGDETARDDCRALVSIMKRETKSEPRMWGSGIIGFGEYQYRYATGREGDWFQAGFSPRKQNLVLYLMGGFEQSADLMKALGKHSTGQSCLYIRRLADVDLSTLTKLIRASIQRTRETNVATARPKEATGETATKRASKRATRRTK
jgi:hypothetical protein